MSLTNKLLQEAIADAKAVKETALANARLSLEEMFKPQIESMVNKKLDEAEEEESIEEPKTSDDSAETTKPADTDISICDVENGTLNIDLTQCDDTDCIKTINIDLNEPEKPTEYNDTSVEENVVCEDEYLEISDEELDALLANENVDDLDDIEIELEGVDYKDEDEDDIIDLDLESLICDDDDTNECNSIDISTNENADDDIDIILGDRRISVSDVHRGIDNSDENKELKKTNKKLSNDLKEAYGVIKIMRQELSESILTNAKLMYANKLFSKYNLTNEQKLRMLDKFDQAKTIDAVKLIYGTMNESLSMAGTRTQKQIKESFASKQIGSTRPKQTILESTEDAQRNYLMKLAGIK